MLNIINSLKPFIEDCYRRINVREYARIMKISPPTASKILFELNKEELLSIEKDRNEIAYGKTASEKLLNEKINLFLELKKEVEND